ncbi:cyclic nucleotide-gated ion channel subunit A isoform 1-T2 [Glossina fuscipes fuscipes]
MWTYVMASARGDRAHSMMSSRRRQETDSPIYQYNVSRPLYRSARINGRSTQNSNNFTLSTSYPYNSTRGNYSTENTTNTTNSFMQLSNRNNLQQHQQQQQQQQPQQPQEKCQNHISGIDDGYTNSGKSESYEMEDGTSLFSPLTPSCTTVTPADTAILIGRKHLLANRNNTSTNITTRNCMENPAAVVRLTSSNSQALLQPDYNADDNSEQIVKHTGRQFNALPSYQRDRKSYYYVQDEKQNDRGGGGGGGEGDIDDVNDDEDDDDDDADNNDDEDDEEQKNGKNYHKSNTKYNNKLSLDQMKHSKPSTLRRTLNALRQRLTKRSRTKPPDWFVERFSNPTKIDKTSTTATNSNNNDASATNSIAPDTEHEFRCSSLLCNRLSVNPTLQSHYRWLAVVSLAVLYNIIFVVGRAVFWEINNKAAILWHFLDYWCDFIYLIDILVHMHEGYLEQGLLVRDAHKLRRHYFSTKGWCLDFLSILPTDLAYIWWSPDLCGPKNLPCSVIVRLNRLLRLPRMWEWFDRTETATGYPNAFRICKVVLAILVLIHWNACMFFVISYELGFGTDNWVYNLNGERNSSLQRQYIYSFYWSTLTLTTIGETPTPENDAEYLFVVADFLAGVLIFATIVGNIGSMISNMNVSRVEFQNRMDGVKQYMAFRKVGHELEARVIRWFAYTWSQSGALDEERVLAALPDKLKAEIAIQVHMDTLKQVRIFHDCEPGLLEALVLKLRLQVFSPGDYICRKGDVGKEMYIVKRGKLSVVADDGVTVFATLGAGSVFGEVSVLEIAGNRTGNRRTANVRSLGYSDLFCLAKRDLWETLADYPEARATLTERGCQLLRKDGLLDEQVFADSQRVHDSIEGGIEKLEISVENLNMRLARLLAEYTASQAKLKQRLAKLELNYHLAHASLAEQHARPPRSGRLYSLQPKKRPKPRPSSSVKSVEYNKQNTL